MSDRLLSRFSLNIDEAANNLQNIVKHTPLEYNERLSEMFNANIYLKREDLQPVRSYKLRGAYNKISNLTPEESNKGIVCASAGNHAQGVAYSCSKLGIKGVVFMPLNTPKQKINQTRIFGEDFIKIILKGDTFDECAQNAILYAKGNNMIFIPPFNDRLVIEGQGTIAKEILEDSNLPIDYLFIPVGGGGLCAGVGAYFNTFNSSTKIVAVEPSGAASLKAALKMGHPIKLDEIDKFVDGAAVQQVGDITFDIIKDCVSEVCTVPEGEVCTSILGLYNLNAIVVEPAGALSVTALNHYKEQLKGKTAVCIISGSNNDIDRMQEIKELSLLYEGLKHYFIINFAQRKDSLKEFINNILGDSDDIVRFEYMKKNAKEYGPALVGIELEVASDYEKLLDRMNDNNIDYTILDPKSALGRYIV